MAFLFSIRQNPISGLFSDFNKIFQNALHIASIWYIIIIVCKF